MQIELWNQEALREATQFQTNQFPYLFLKISTQSLFLEFKITKTFLAIRANLTCLRLRTPKPPLYLLSVVVSQPIVRKALLLPFLPQRKFMVSLAILFKNSGWDKENREIVGGNREITAINQHHSISRREGQVILGFNSSINSINQKIEVVYR